MRQNECALICVPPDQVALVWPYVCGPIHAAIRRGNLSSFQPVAESVLRGDALLWLAWNGELVQAAAVTELQQTEWRKVCVIVACGGTDSRSQRGAGMRRWVGLLEGIEAYARAAGCSATRIMGRKGWARVLASYKAKRIVLEKDL